MTAAAAVIFTGALAIDLSTQTAIADGAISGKVNFDGPMRKARKIRIKGDAFCVKAHAGNPLLRETYLFNMEKKTLLNVIVYISDGVPDDLEAAAPPEIEIDQQGCQYVPHVNAIMTGQKVLIKNTDDTAHNLNLKSVNNPSFNEGQPVKGMSKEVTFPNAELAIPLKCDVHSWMSSWIAVFDNPFHVINDANGEYTIKGLPAGTYKISVWHEFDKFHPVEKTIEVTVKDGETSKVDFTYKPPSK